MPQNPANRVRVSTPAGHFTMSAVVAARGGSKFRVLQQDALDKFGRSRPPKLRVDVEEAPAPRKRATRKLRGDTAAATPTTQPETVSGDTPEE